MSRTLNHAVDGHVEGTVELAQVLDGLLQGELSKGLVESVT